MLGKVELLCYLRKQMVLEASLKTCNTSKLLSAILSAESLKTYIKHAPGKLALVHTCHAVITRQTF